MLSINTSLIKQSKRYVESSQGSSSLTGLIFPKNGDAPATFTAFALSGADLPPIQPLTVMMKYFPYQQNGYHTTFFHGRADGQLPNNNHFFGAHPYPQGGSGGTVHNWEVAYNFQDFITDLNSNSTIVVKNQWYRQAVTCINTPDTVIDFQWDLATDVNRLVRATNAGLSISNDPNTPNLIFGDSPWAQLGERLSGILRGIQVYTAKLTQPQITQLSPLDTDAAVLAKCAELGITSSLWYLNINPTPDDISDKSGANHNPAWKTAQKATLWTG